MPQAGFALLKNDRKNEYCGEKTLTFPKSEVKTAHKYCSNQRNPVFCQTFAIISLGRLISPAHGDLEGTVGMRVTKKMRGNLLPRICFKAGPAN